MGERFFGYGRWSAPYWFIGPEQGQGLEEGNDLTRREQVWREFGCPDLTDCAQYHRAIGVLHWHGDRPRLQSTWRRLLLLLNTYLDRPIDNETLRVYQQNSWGSSVGETCMMNLSAHAANNMKAHAHRMQYLPERVMQLRRKLDEHKPELVVMFGRVYRDYWHTIADAPLSSAGFGEVGLAKNGTLCALTPHPNRSGANSRWADFGRTLRDIRAGSAQMASGGPAVS